MRKRYANIVLGLILVIIGIAYVGNVLNLWDYRFSFDGWWTLFIIIPCILSIIGEGFKFINVTGLTIGCVFLLTEQNIIKNDLGYKLIFPIIIIFLGLSIIFKKTYHLPKDFNGVYTNQKGIDFYAILGGNSPNFTNRPFIGANCYSILGGVNLILKQAIIEEDCVINVYSILGGTEIDLPTNVNLIVNSTPILGGVENKFVSSSNPNAPKVLINAVSVLGGTEIK